MTALTVKKLEKVVQKALIEWLSPLGFTLESNGGCGRWQGDIYTYIGCVVNRVGGLNRIRPFGQMGFLHRKKIFSAFMSDNQEESNKIAVDLQADYAHFMRSWNADMRCQNEEEVDEFLSALHSFVFDRLYPTLTAFADPIQVLDLYIKYDETNRTSFDLPGWSGHSSALTAMILARLHAPHEYPALKKRYQPIFDQLLPEYKGRAEKLIAYLDQEKLANLN